MTRKASATGKRNKAKSVGNKQKHKIQTPIATDQTATPQPFPKAAAEALIRKNAASLPTEIQSHLISIALDHFQKLHSIYTKTTKLTRMTEDEEFIPRSARLGFNLTANARTAQEAAFITLQQQTTSMIGSFQKQLRKQILHSAKLEKQTLLTEAAEHLAYAIRLTTQVCLLQASSNKDIDEVVGKLFHSTEDTLTRHLDISIPNFKQIYSRTNSTTWVEPLAQQQAAPAAATAAPPAAAAAPPAASRFFVDAFMPSPRTTRAPATMPTTLSTVEDFDDANDTSDSIVYHMQSEMRPARNQTTVTLDDADLKIFKTLNDLYLDPWIHFLQQTDAQNKSLLLKKVFAESMTTRSTADVATLLDTERAANPEQLQDLIRKSVEKEVTKVWNKSTTKNFQGRATSTPSVQNKTTGSDDITNSLGQMNTSLTQARQVPKQKETGATANKTTGQQGRATTSTTLPDTTGKKKVTFGHAQGGAAKGSTTASSKNKRKRNRKKSHSKPKPTGQLKKPPPHA